MSHQEHKLGRGNGQDCKAEARTNIKAEKKNKKHKMELGYFRSTFKRNKKMIQEEVGERAQ